jgi:hypothetical protein
MKATSTNRFIDRPRVITMKSKPKPNPQFDAFTDITNRLLAVSHDEIQRREKEYRARAAKNPRKRGPKKKVKASVSPDRADA